MVTRKLAFESGLHRSFVGHVERQARNISLDNIERLARTLGVPVHVLLTADRLNSDRSGICRQAYPQDLWTAAWLSLRRLCHARGFLAAQNLSR
jgi:transcriptional regulator with XRE-family HTH domain